MSTASQPPHGAQIRMAMTVSGLMMAHQVAGKATLYARERFGECSNKLHMPIKRHAAPSYLSKASEAGFAENGNRCAM